MVDSHPGPALFYIQGHGENDERCDRMSFDLQKRTSRSLMRTACPSAVALDPAAGRYVFSRGNRVHEVTRGQVVKALPPLPGP
jgi:hypothetical protein